MHRFSFHLLLVFIPLLVITGGFAQAQPPSPAGTWQGVLLHRSCLGTNASMQVTMTLKEAGNGFTGTVAYAFGFNEIGQAMNSALFTFSCKAVRTQSGIQVNYFATDEINNNLFTFGFYVMGSYSLVLDYANADGQETLTGLYRGSNGGRGELRLRRETDSSNSHTSGSSLLAQLRQKQLARKSAAINTIPETATVSEDRRRHIRDSLQQLQQAERTSTRYLQQREAKIWKTIAVPDSLPYVELALYDNAIVDGDTVSLFVDNVLVLHRAALTGKPLVQRIFKPVNKTAALSVKIIAENLGTIPPNTAVAQVVNAGKTERFFIQSDLQSNGTIEFIWQQ